MASDESIISRRRVLAALGGMSAVSIAGCSSNGGGSNDTTTSGAETSTGRGSETTDTNAGATNTDSGTTSTTSPGSDTATNTGTATDTDSGTETGTTSGGTSQQGTSTNLGKAVESAFDLPPNGQILPSDANFHFASTNLSTENYGVMALTLTPFGGNQYAPDGEYIPILMSKSHLIEDNSVWEVKLSEKDFTWHNGKPVTIEDYYNQAKYNWEYTKGIGDEPEFEKIEMVDDRTVHHTLREPQAAGLFFAEREPDVEFPRWQTKKWLKRMKNAKNEKQAQKVQDDLADTTLPIDEYVGNGLFELTDWTDRTYTATKYEEHPFAGQQNIETIKFHVYGGDAAQRLAFKQGKVDAAKIPGKNVQTSSELERITFKKNANNVLLYNQYHKDLKKRAVRQALSYLFDEQDLITNKDAPRYSMDPYNGMPDPVNEQFFEDWESTKSKYIQYGKKGQPDKATSVLKEAGYSKDGNTWVDGDGKPLKFTIKSIDWFEGPLKTMISQLNQFGIPAEYKFNNDSYYQILGQPKGNWDAIITNAPNSTIYPPVYYADNSRALGLQLSETKHYANRPWKVTIPEKMGQRTPSGSGREIDLVKLQTEFSKPDLSDKRFNEILQTMTQYWNVDQPSYSFLAKYKGGIFDTENFAFQDLNGGDELWPAIARQALTTGDWHGKSQ